MKNVMITINQKVKIIDFGLCSRGKVSKIKGGSPGFLAPEFFTDAPLTAKCDVWAVGVILYMLLTRSFPYKLPYDLRSNDLIYLNQFGKIDYDNMTIASLPPDTL
jgi:serine/threonine-protein kinase